MTFGLDFQIQKRIVSAETILGNMVFEFNKLNLAKFINLNLFFSTREKDGFDRSRFEHTQQLSRYFQEHLKKSQNPDKCEDARFLVSQVKYVRPLKSISK